MKKLIMESLLVFAMLVFVASSARAEKPEDVMDNKSNVFQSSKRYAMNMTDKSGKGKKATSTTELQTFDPYISAPDGNDATMKQLRMILLILCMPGPWQSISMNIQLQ